MKNTLFSTVSGLGIATASLYILHRGFRKQVDLLLIKAGVPEKFLEEPDDEILNNADGDAMAELEDAIYYE